MAPLTLTVDVSNAITSLVLWHDEHPEHHWQLSTDTRRSEDELAILLAQLAERDAVQPQCVGAVGLACVVPSAAGATVAALEQVFGTVTIVGPGVRTGLRIRTDDPREVGADRVANAVAAIARHGAPVIVLDFATALTLDVIDADGAYRGAVIAPGLLAASETLATRTARLGAIDFVAPECALSQDTDSALRAGAIFGYAGLVEGLVNAVRAEVGPARVVATGEHATVGAILEQVTVVDVFDALLTHDGLRRILALNVGPTGA